MGGRLDPMLWGLGSQDGFLLVCRDPHLVPVTGRPDVVHRGKWKLAELQAGVELLTKGVRSPAGMGLFLVARGVPNVDTLTDMAGAGPDARGGTEGETGASRVGPHRMEGKAEGVQQLKEGDHSGVQGQGNLEVGVIRWQGGHIADNIL